MYKSVYAFISLYNLICVFRYRLINFYLKESEVINEELHDNDSFEYANMPPLVTHKSPVYLSHSDPPFLYQYIGDQVKIVQVLGNFPLQSDSNSVNNNTDHRDQKEVTTKEASLSNTILKSGFNQIPQNGAIKTEIDNNDTTFFVDIQEEKQLNLPCTEISDSSNTNEKQKPIEMNLVFIDAENKYLNNNENMDKKIEKMTIENEDKQKAYIDNLHNVIESAESDDEASFGTPDNSPRYKRKSPKGKYGKSKAPLPPKEENEIIKGNENLNDVVTEMVSPEANITEDVLFETPVIEKRQRHKSKSPVKNSIINTSGISRLLQLPAKLAFWHKNEEFDKPDDSSSSRSNSRRSSFTDKTVDEFESCSDLNETTQSSGHVLNIPQIEITNDEATFKIDAGVDTANAKQDIGELDAQPKTLESTSENSIEYKYIPLHDSNETTTTTSKSTDV